MGTAGAPLPMPMAVGLLRMWVEGWDGIILEFHQLVQARTTVQHAGMWRRRSVPLGEFTADLFYAQ